MNSSSNEPQIKNFEYFFHSIPYNDMLDRDKLNKINQIKFPERDLIKYQEASQAEYVYEKGKELVSAAKDFFGYGKTEVQTKPLPLNDQERKFRELVTNRNEIELLIKKMNKDGAVLKQIILQTKNKEISADQQRQILELEHLCDITMLQIIAKRCDLLKGMISIISDNSSEELTLRKELHEEFSKAWEENRELSKRISEIKKTLGISPAEERQEEYFLTPLDQALHYPLSIKAVAYSDQKIEEKWMSTSWGKLLLPENSKAKTFKDNLGIGFESSVTGLKKKKRELQSVLSSKKKELEQYKTLHQIPDNIGEEQRKKLETDFNLTLEQKHQVIKEIELQIGQLKKTTSHTLLLRIIDVMGQKVREKKKAEKNPNLQSPEIIEKEIKELQTAYDKNIKRYQEICLKEAEQIKKDKASINTAYAFLWDFISSSVKDFASSIASKFYSPKEISRKFQYAQMGYSIMENVRDFLNNLPENVSPQKAIILEIEKFLTWSKWHPWTAAELASDIMLTCYMLKGTGEKGSEFDAMIASLEIKAGVSAFNIGFHNPEDEEPVEQEEQLKYRALADICRYLPVAAGIGVGMVQFIRNEEWSVLGLTKTVGKQVLKAAGTQMISRSIPKGYEDMALSLAQIIRQDSFTQIMDKRAELATIQMAGGIKDIIRNPKGVFEGMKRSAIIWARTLKNSKGDAFIFRVLVQAVLPIACVIGSGVVLTLGIIGSVFTFGASLGLAGAIVGTGWSLYSKLYTFVDGYDWQTRNKVENDLIREDKQKYKAELLKVSGKEIENLKKNYLNNLPSPSNVATNLTDEEKAIVNGPMKEAIKKDLKESLDHAVQQNKTPVKTPGDYFKIFSENLMMNEKTEEKDKEPHFARSIIKEIKNRLAQENLSLSDSAFDYFSSEIYQDMIKEWLDKRIEASIVELCLESDLLVGKERNEGQKVALDQKVSEIKSDLNDTSQQNAILEVIDESKKGSLEEFLKIRMTKQHGYTAQEVTGLMTKLSDKEGLNRPLF